MSKEGAKMLKWIICMIIVTFCLCGFTLLSAKAGIISDKKDEIEKEDKE